MPVVLVPLLLALDQILKLWALENLSPVPRPLVEGLLYLTLVRNTGAGFGLLGGQAFLLGWLSLLVGTVLLYLLAQKRYPTGKALALSLLAAGALGNGIDRLGRGWVVDYLDLGTSIPLIAHFPVFNLADVCVTLGAALLLLAPRGRRY
ncbi:MAG: signal peptidase II [Thermus sp.]|uniref:signal peptidase II n=1 Tax=unclassified Thermus TaxID=2619321 RepID=UPI00059DF593|nr:MULTISPECIES: signal peptidase II [unclassified Thermus]MCS6867658.1 signal peptidase II [Thermus sp.]MCS7217510.1 signal peptidase II [Thermus sp.]MCX7848855.1 signal peptidase II [Thermus sp.]MDW8016748.1 signal peptidase II [Thermus sp.]MDW8357450.1 signal peptidase II [Thermus sp.]